MALRRTLEKRLLTTGRAPARLSTAPPSIRNDASPTNVTVDFRREYFSCGGKTGLFRMFFHRVAAHEQYLRLPEIFSLPVGENLREKLSGINSSGVRKRLEGLSPTPPPPPAVRESSEHVSIKDARKLFRLALVGKLKAKLRTIPENSISYSEFIRILSDGCENPTQVFEYAKMLDESGNVIVLGDVVFLRPEEVARSMNMIISESIGLRNDPRRGELEEMEKQKARIDSKARACVRSELYCGLGLVLAQTIGFMRLTFWELSWDVMEPICFFVASLHFAIGYAFFIRTSVEPSFEGYFQRRFKTKQQKLMKIHSFDVGKYHSLCGTFYSCCSCGVSKCMQL